MYLYLLTYWCQKCMHQNVTLTHNYKENAFCFSSITSIEKLCTEKRARWQNSTLETNVQQIQKNNPNSYCLGVLDFKSYFHSKDLGASSPKSKHFRMCSQKGLFKKLSDGTKTEMHLSGITLYLKHITFEIIFNRYYNGNRGTDRVKGVEKGWVLVTSCGGTEYEHLL